MKKVLYLLLCAFALLPLTYGTTFGAMTIPDVGADAILATYFNNTRPGGGNNHTLKLYCTNVTPADTDTAATYTVCAGGGYSDITLTNGSWTVAAINDPSDAVYAEQTFTLTGVLTTNGTIYGYIIVDADNTLIVAEKFSQSFTPTAAGGTVKVTPKIQASKGTPN